MPDQAREQVVGMFSFCPTLREVVWVHPVVQSSDYTLPYKLPFQFYISASISVSISCFSVWPIGKYEVHGTQHQLTLVGKFTHDIDGALQVALTNLQQFALTLQKSERKSCGMNIIMCRASYSGWMEAWPHNFIHVHSFLVLVLQGLSKKLYWS